MFNEEIPVMQISIFFGTAKILSYNEKEKTAFLQIQNNDEEVNAYARLAIPNSPLLGEGDLVLAAGNDIDHLFIIGLITIKEKNNIISNKIFLDNGSFASISSEPENKKLQVHSKEGELIFEYDSTTGSSRVNIQKGNLEFITEKGSINFISGEDINFKSKNSVSIESQWGIRLAINNTINKVLLALNPAQIKLSSPELKLTTQQANIQSENMNYIGSKFSGVVKTSKIVVNKLETVANDIISKAKNIFSDVDELAQFKAGRIRTLVKSTLHIKAKNSYLKSEKDFKINGSKIHLG